MGNIHPTAVIEDGASIGDGVTIGAFCHIGPNVEIAADVWLDSHVIIAGHTKIGQACKIFSLAVLGQPPQDLKYDGSPTRLEVGARTIIREQATIHRGTPEGGGVTRVGDDCFLMVATHVAHDCQIGNNVILVNLVTMGGHCEIGNFTIVSGVSAIQQFVRIGSHVFIAGGIGIEQDVIPFGLAKGRHRAYLSGLNLIGLKRRSLSKKRIFALRDAYRMLFTGEMRLIQQRAEEAAKKHQGEPLVEELLAFVTARPDRSLCLPRQRNQKTGAGDEED